MRIIKLLLATIGLAVAAVPASSTAPGPANAAGDGDGDCGVAAVAPRYAGTNPGSYGSNAPRLGEVLLGFVRLQGTTGHDLAIIVGYEGTANIELNGGQTLLVDITAEFSFATPAVGGPIAYFFVQVPNDPSACGLVVNTQAVHFGGVEPFALSNAMDLTVGL